MALAAVAFAALEVLAEETAVRLLKRLLLLPLEAAREAEALLGGGEREEGGASVDWCDVIFDVE